MLNAGWEKMLNKLLKVYISTKSCSHRNSFFYNSVLELNHRNAIIANIDRRQTLYIEHQTLYLQLSQNPFQTYFINNIHLNTYVQKYEQEQGNCIT